jgi:hypothetical protein
VGPGQAGWVRQGHMKDKKLYMCIGCREIHFDSDYSEEDGDILIIDWNKFLSSVKRLEVITWHPPSQIKKAFHNGKEKNTRR